MNNMLLLKFAAETVQRCSICARALFVHEGTILLLERVLSALHCLAAVPDHPFLK